MKIKDFFFFFQEIKRRRAQGDSTGAQKSSVVVLKLALRLGLNPCRMLTLLYIL